ncbi:SIR2 family NAD-dependent protein deacylase [Evansella clarkii]|uniref:SIR2 family NAD-dependent protein deacylase n=1 Tax=Evansella clarkii TaxID=79879 RepID=UPI001F2EA8F9|nr:NAD-dependent deacylase [Evansella clarkii]
MLSETKEKAEMTAQIIAQQKNTVILTGAGMSTESGIPDFRSESGWWRKIDQLSIATAEAVEENYSVFHEFYSDRLSTLSECRPHEGHYCLASWEKSGLVTLLATQNVDGFHQKAGSVNVEELHGSIHRFRCHNCGEIADKEEFMRQKPCRECEGKLRPSVVLFGEMLPETAWQRSMELVEKAELVLVIGSSLQVYPVSQLPAITRGKTALINRDETSADTDFDLVMKGSAKEILQYMDNYLKNAEV